MGLGINVDVAIQPKSDGRLENMAYGPSGDFNVSYGSSSTLGGLVGDKTSLLVVAIVLLFWLKKKKG